MTTNQPFGSGPLDPTAGSSTAGSTADASPAGGTTPGGSTVWGTAPSAPPAGSGSDDPSFTPPPQPGLPAPAGARFFGAIRDLGMVRPDPGQGRRLAGVAAAVARRYQVDPVVARIAFAVLTLAGGLGVLLYGLGWMLLPQPDGRIHAQQVLTGTVTAGFAGALLTLLAAAHHLIPFLFIALVIVMIVQHRRTRRAQAC